jgi:hypothetical protein
MFKNSNKIKRNKNLFFFILFIGYATTNFAQFTNPAGGTPPQPFFGNPDSPPEDDDPAAVPINNYYWVLVLAGAGLGAFKIQNQKTTHNY